MLEPTVEGEMFSITVDGPRAEIRLWRRPDLDSETGTHNAARLSEEGSKLPARGVRRILLDVRDAPAVAGPKSIASMTAMMAAWTNPRTRVAILVSADPIKVLQFKRVVTEAAPQGTRVMTDPDEAAQWLAATD